MVFLFKKYFQCSLFHFYPPSPVATHKSPPKSCFKCTCICLNENVCDTCPTSSLRRVPQLVWGRRPLGCLCATHVWMGEVIEREACSSSFLCFSVRVFVLRFVFCGLIVFCCRSFVPFGRFTSLFVSLLCRPRTSGSYFRGTWNILCVCSFIRLFFDFLRISSQA